MTTETLSFLQFPLALLAAVVLLMALWLLTAVILSYLIPAKPQLPGGETPLPRLPDVDEKCRLLMEKIQALESASPALSPGLERFDHRVETLRRELAEVKNLLESTLNKGRNAQQLTRQVDELSRRTLSLIKPPARSGAPQPANYQIEPGWIKTQYILQEARKTREEWGQLQERHGQESARQAEALKEEAARGAAYLQAFVPQWKQLEGEKQDLNLEWGAMLNQRQDFQARRQSVEQAGVPLETLQEANNQLQARLAEMRRQLEEDRARNQRRMTRLARRLDRWRGAWQQQLQQQSRTSQVEIEALRHKSAAIQSQWAAEKARWTEENRVLLERRKRLAFERQNFQKTVVEPWETERAAYDRQLETLRQEKSSLEQVIPQLQAQAEEEKKSFQSLVLRQRDALRQEQKEWRARHAVLREEAARDLAAGQESLSHAQSALDAEKSALGQALAIQRERLESALHVVAGEKNQFEARLATEKSARVKALNETHGQVAELRRLREALQRTINQDLQEHLKLRSEQRRWAEGRLRRLNDLSAALRDATLAKINALRQETDTLRNALASARKQARADGEALAQEFAGKEAELKEMQRQSAETHAAFLARTKAEERELAYQCLKLERTVFNMQQKLLQERDKYEARLRRQKERHERAILTIQQRLDQKKVDGERQLAEERQGIASLRQRVASRRQRLEKVSQARREAAQKVFDALQETMRSVRDGQWLESREWIEKLAAYRQRLDRWRRRQDAAKDAPRRLAEASRRAEAAEAQSHAVLRAKLRDESEKYWASLADASAKNRDIIQGHLEVLGETNAGLERQEKALREFMTQVSKQVLQLEFLRRGFTAAQDKPQPN